MERPYFFNDQLVLSEDLNSISDSLIGNLQNVIRSFLGRSGGYNEDQLVTYGKDKGGVIGSPSEHTMNKNLKVVKVQDDTIRIYPGAAILDPGELIVLPGILTISKGESSLYYRWTSSPNDINYVKISYAEATGSLKADDLGVLHPTRYYRSFFVSIDNLPPSTSSEILLARFQADGNGNIDSSGIEDTRLYTKWFTTADSVGVDPYKVPVPTHKSVADHIYSTGSATPTPNNPHGLSFDDLGGDLKLLQKRHATDLHVNGIIPIGVRNQQTLDSYKGVINDQYIGAYISFNPPSNAFLLVNGNVITGSLPILRASDAPSDGLYFAVVNSQGGVEWKEFDSFFLTYIDNLFSFNLNGYHYSTGHKGIEYYPLGVAEIADAGDDILSWTDCRTFYGNNILDIAADYEEGVQNPSTSELTLTSSLKDTLQRLRYQIGKALTGTGSNWKSSNPLTAGPTSDADPYHTHLSLQNKSDIYVIPYSLFDPYIPPTPANLDFDQFLDVCQFIPWHNITGNQISQADIITGNPTSGTGSFQITIKEKGIYEVALCSTHYCSYQVTGSYGMIIIKPYPSGSMQQPQWQVAGWSFAQVDSHYTYNSLITKAIVNVDDTSGIYNKLLVTGYNYVTQPIICMRNTRNLFNFNDLHGGYATYLRITKLKNQ
uniref:Uncharacterized protein n=1 Tax=Dictyoglomus turgidum TaxID=513050 RepID=A0A7C3WUT3_9BACT